MAHGCRSSPGRSENRFCAGRRAGETRPGRRLGALRHPLKQNTVSKLNTHYHSAPPVPTLISFRLSDPPSPRLKFSYFPLHSLRHASVLSFSFKRFHSANSPCKPPIFPSPYGNSPSRPSPGLDSQLAEVTILTHEKRVASFLLISVSSNYLIHQVPSSFF